MFPLWVTAEFLLAVLVKYVTSHLFIARLPPPRPNFSSNNTFPLPLESEELASLNSKVLSIISQFKSCVGYVEKKGHGRMAGR